MKIMGCEVIEREILRGMDIAIKQGDKLYVWPGFVQPKELKYMEVPTMEETMEEWARLSIPDFDIILPAHRVPFKIFQ